MTKREEAIVLELRKLATAHDDVMGFGEIVNLLRRAANRIEEQRRQIEYLENDTA